MNIFSHKLPAPAALMCATTFGLALLTGCAPLDINVGTQEPLDVKLNLDIHLYQHGEAEEGGEEKEEPESAGEAAESSAPSYKDVVNSRRDREGEIWTLKGNRLVGESRQGVLEIRNLPGGDWGKYVEKTVEAENMDREFIIKHEADQRGKSEAEVRRMIWREWQLKSFAGDWIEVEDKETGEFRWIQKKEPPKRESGNGESPGDGPKPGKKGEN